MPGSSWRSEPAAAFRGFGAGFLPAADLGVVEAGEPGEREVDLAAHLEERRRRFALVGADAERHGRHGAQVPRHVLAARAVPARRAADERALLVDERDRGAVDLRLDHVGDRLVRPQPLAHVRGPLLQRLRRRHLLERAHRLQVVDLREPAGRGAADALRRRVGGDQLRVVGFERAELVVEHVVRAVRDLRIVEHVVAVVVVLDEPSELGRPRGGIRGRGMELLGGVDERVGTGVGQPLVGVDAAPADGDRAHARRLPGADVEGRVADVGSVLRARLEPP